MVELMVTESVVNLFHESAHADIDHSFFKDLNLHMHTHTHKQFECICHFCSCKFLK